MPHQIQRRKGTFTIYTQEEADAGGISFCPLRKITGPTAETGLWALVDDGFVAEVLDVRCYTDSHGYTKHVVTLSFGRVWLPRKKAYLFLPFYESGNYGGTAPRSWVDYEVKKTRTRRAVKLYAALLLTGRSIDWHFLAQVYRPDQGIRTVRKLFREPRIQKMVRDEMREGLAGCQMSMDEIVRMYKDLFETAKERGQLNIAKDILDIFVNMSS